MFFYNFNANNKSQVLVICIEHSFYILLYQYMEKECGELESFYVSRKLKSAELKKLYNNLDKEFHENNVPNFIIEKFKNNFEN